MKLLNGLARVLMFVDDMVDGAIENQVARRGDSRETRRAESIAILSGSDHTA